MGISNMLSPSDRVDRKWASSTRNFEGEDGIRPSQAGSSGHRPIRLQCIVHIHLRNVHTPAAGTICLYPAQTCKSVGATLPDFHLRKRLCTAEGLICPRSLDTWQWSHHGEGMPRPSLQICPWLSRPNYTRQSPNSAKGIYRPASHPMCHPYSSHSLRQSWTILICSSLRLRQQSHQSARTTHSAFHPLRKLCKPD